MVTWYNRWWWAFSSPLDQTTRQWCAELFITAGLYATSAVMTSYHCRIKWCTGADELLITTGSYTRLTVMTSSSPPDCTPDRRWCALHRHWIMIDRRWCPLYVYQTEGSGNDITTGLYVEPAVMKFVTAGFKPILITMVIPAHFHKQWWTGSERGLWIGGDEQCVLVV